MNIEKRIIIIVVATIIVINSYRNCVYCAPNSRTWVQYLADNMKNIFKL
jgi:hypothetical protein